MPCFFRLARDGRALRHAPAKTPIPPSYRQTAMHALSESARAVLDRMVSERRYEPEDLRAFVPAASIERLRDIMHELWINRQVERVGHSAWRRHRSAPPNSPSPVSREVQPARPEDLFDHAAFADFFK